MNLVKDNFGTGVLVKNALVYGEQNIVICNWHSGIEALEVRGWLVKNKVMHNKVQAWNSQLYSSTRPITQS